jgi:hypothetical protein
MEPAMPTQYQQDSYVFEIGEEISAIYYVLEGTLGLMHRFESDGQEYEVLVSQIKGNTFLGVENFFDSLFASYSVKALEDSTINETPIENKKALKVMVKDKPDYGLQILRSLLRTIAQTANFVIQFNKLCGNIKKLETIGKGILGYLSSQYNVEIASKELQEVSKQAFDFFQEHDTALYPLSQNIFSVPFEEFQEEDKESIMDMLDKREVNLFTKLYTLPSKVQNEFFAREPFFINYYLEEGSEHFRNVLFLMEKAFEQIRERYNALLGNEGVVLSLLETKGSLGSNKELLRYVRQAIGTLLSNTEKLSKLMQTHAPEYYQGLVVTIEKLKKLNQAVSAEEGQAEVEETYSVPEELKGALETILRYAELDEETYHSFVDDFNKFKMMKDKLSGDDSVKRFRKRISEAYWKIYENCFIKYFNSMEMPKAVELMLRYGFMDEELVHPKTIVRLYTATHQEVDRELPVYDIFDWLMAIARKEVDPGINGMGERYDQYLREEAKKQSRKTVVTAEELDTTQRRVSFEIQNMVKDGARVCSGEIFNYSPILMEEAFAGDSYKYLVTKKKIREEFFKIRSLDYSAFYREVRFRDADRGIEEFIETEIMPNIILLPTWGKKSMTWQVKEKPKESRGRVIFPHFVLEKLDRMMVEVFGFYRWEIVKEILGPLWNDITQMSITAEYTDYIQFYKKNRDLSLETKEKIAQDFKKHRTDRERFVYDYTKWIEFESQGRPMLNKVVRGIFYRQIPFPKEIRDKIKDMPAYSEIHNRFVNLRRKDIKKLKNKYQKYAKEEQGLPRELQEYIEFYLR